LRPSRRSATSWTTTKVIWLSLPNDSDANYYREQDIAATPEGPHKMVDGGGYQDGTEDYSNMIQHLQDPGVEIMVSVMIPPDFTNFWKQASSRAGSPGWCMRANRAFFPSVGKMRWEPIANGVMSDLWWHRCPRSSLSLTGRRPALNWPTILRRRPTSNGPSLFSTTSSGRWPFWTPRTPRSHEQGPRSSSHGGNEARHRHGPHRLFRAVGDADRRPAIRTSRLGPGSDQELYDSGVGGGPWLMQGRQVEVRSRPRRQRREPLLDGGPADRTKALPFNRRSVELGNPISGSSSVRSSLPARSSVRDSGASRGPFSGPGMFAGYISPIHAATR